VFSFCRCVKEPIIDHCSQYNVATNGYVYQFTSAANFSHLLNFVQSSFTLLQIQGIPNICQLALKLLLCNIAYMPCNLTTGTPKPLCSELCLYLRQNCSFQYKFSLKHVALRGYPMRDDCSNTLHHLKLWYGVQLSSNNFENDCLSFDLESKRGYCTCTILLHAYIYR